MAEKGGKANFAEERATIDLRVLTACADFASKDPERWNLNGVFLDLQPRSSRYVATDGRRLIIYHDAFASMFDNTLVGQFTIPTRICRTHAVSKEHWLGELSHGKTDTSLVLRYGQLGLDFEPIDGDFPAYGAIVPRGRSSGEGAQFNPDLLVSFVKFSKALQGGAAFVAYDGPANPARVHFSDIPALGVVSPLKHVQEDRMPEWLEAA